jgi:chromosome partitioning protein
MERPVACCECGTSFVPSLAIQVAEEGGHKRHYCSGACRERTKPAVQPRAPAVAVCVLNQKGGTGKTTSAVSIAAGLAERGHDTLLVDLDPQGSVGASLGVRSPRAIQHVLLDGISPALCATPVRDHLDVITSDDALARAEVELARQGGTAMSQRLTERMGTVGNYQYVVFDCAPSISILNTNALVFARRVLIPVSCDYLSLVGVKQILKTLRRVKEQQGCTIAVAGVLPTFFDIRNRVCTDVMEHLQKTFGERTLSPIRVNTRLAEAPNVKKTIFEHAPGSHGADDYNCAVDRLVLRLAEAPRVTSRAA